MRYMSELRLSRNIRYTLMDLIQLNYMCLDDIGHIVHQQRLAINDIKKKPKHNRIYEIFNQMKLQIKVKLLCTPQFDPVQHRYHNHLVSLV